MSSTALKDFAWTVNTAVASDSVSGLNKPLLRLQLFLAGTAAIPRAVVA